MPRQRTAHAARTVLLLLAAAGASVAQTTWYVDGDALAGGATGASWTDAFLELQSALAVATAGDDVRVAGGAYTPGVARTDSFAVPAGVTVLGGYAGFGAPNPDVRDLLAHETVLSGDLAGDDLPGFLNRVDNAYHVVTIPPGPAAVVLDGLTVRGGQADGDHLSGQLFGGGVYAADGVVLTLRDCRLVDNFAGAYGGGLYAFSSLVDLRRCDVVGNRMDHDVAPATSLNAAGAGVYTELGDTTLFGCLFQDNVCEMGAWPDTGFGAAGAGLEQAVAIHVTHCRFVDNVARAVDYREGRGGGLGALVTGSVGVVAECVFEGNLLDVPPGDEGDAGGGAWIDGFVRVVACRFLGNAAPTTFGGGLALLNQAVTPLATVEHCEFSGNTAAYAGGLYVINLSATPLRVVGCTAWANQADFLVGGVMNFGAVAVRDCVLWGNTDFDGSGETSQVDAIFGPAPGVTYCDVQGWSAGGAGNLALDPLFVDAAGPDLQPGTLDDDLRLAPGSPCIDAGTNGALVADLGDLDRDGDTAEPTPVDAGGLLRRADDPLAPDTGSGTAPLVDMGAHEFGSALPDERWSAAGGGVAGSHGTPLLVGRGTLCAFTQVELELSGALELTTAALVIGVTPLDAPFKGGTLVPAPDIVIPGIPTGPLGGFTLAFPWVDEEYPGVPLWWQVWIQDPAGPAGWAASDAVLGTTP